MTANAALIAIASISLVSILSSLGVNIAILLMTEEPSNMTLSCPQCPACPAPPPVVGCATAQDVGRVENLILNNVVGGIGQVLTRTTAIQNRPALCYQSDKSGTRRSHNTAGRQIFGPLTNFPLNYTCTPNITPGIRTIMSDNPNDGSYVRINHFVSPTTIWTVVWKGKSPALVTDVFVSSSSDLRLTNDNTIGASSTVVHTFRGDSHIMGSFFGYSNDYACLFLSTTDLKDRVLCFVSNSSKLFSDNEVDLDIEEAFIDGSIYWGDNAEVLVGKVVGDPSCRGPFGPEVTIQEGQCYIIHSANWTMGLLSQERELATNRQHRVWFDQNDLVNYRMDGDRCKVIEYYSTVQWSRVYWGVRNSQAMLVCIGDSEKCFVFKIDSTEAASAKYNNEYETISAFSVFVEGAGFINVGLRQGCFFGGTVPLTPAGNEEQCSFL